jgi:hypothetical protein
MTCAQTFAHKLLYQKKFELSRAFFVFLRFTLGAFEFTAVPRTAATHRAALFYGVFQFGANLSELTIHIYNA